MSAGRGRLPSAAPYAADSARSASRKSRCRGTGGPRRAPARPPWRRFPAPRPCPGAPVPQDYRSRIFRNETRPSPEPSSTTNHVGFSHACGRFHGRLDAVGLVMGWNDDGDVTARRHAPILVGDGLRKRARPTGREPGVVAVTVNTDSSPVTWRILRTAGRGLLSSTFRHAHGPSAGRRAARSCRWSRRSPPGHVHHEPHRVVHVQLRGQLALQPGAV